MPKAEITIKACGGEHKLAWPIGALEEIAEVNDQFEEMARGFEQSLWRWPEVRVVLDAGLRCGGAKITSAEFIEDQGVRAAVQLAYRGLVCAFDLHDPGKNVLSPVEKKPSTTAASELQPT